MVRAILAGTKTQTRRALKTQPLEILTPRDSRAKSLAATTRVFNGKRTWFALKGRDPNRGDAFFCRYGEVGDRLWVRETWAIPPGSDRADEVVYRADLTDAMIAEERAIRRRETREAAELRECGHVDSPWRPSIHMPRAFSRITLELTEIRIERLRDISEADARAEGVEVTARENGALAPFRDLWRSINGAESWDANPWVWVLTFRLVNAAILRGRGRQ